MGPSGAGKTTLLDTLSQRKRVGTVDGEFLLDGKNLAIDFSRSTGFRIITLLELEPLADALIGEPGVGLTVEERKRVTIGVELAAKPEALLFLDEPTSGLDSTGALSIVRFLKKLADEEGLAVLCTIHQPSAILFEDFDDVLLLTTGGEEVYFGPIGDNGSTIIEYFERNGARKAAGDANPAEYILETIRRAPGTRSWAEIWEDSTEAKAVVDEIESINGSRRAILNSEHHQDRTLEYAMSLSAQTLEVTKRVWLNYWRDASYGYSKMFSNLSMALLCGVLFINSGTTIQELQSRTFGVYAIVHVSQMILTGVQPKFLEFRTLYETRERNSRIYSSTAFITAMILVEIPYAVLGSLVFFFPWWYMEGLPRSSGSAGYAFFLVVLYEIWMPHVAMWIAAMCKDMTVMSVVNPFVFVVSNGFAGIFVQYAQLPEFYRRWLFWVNPQTWLVKGLVSTALHDLRIHCARDEWVTFRPPGGQTCGEYAGGWVEHAFGRIENLAAREECRYCRYKVGDEFLETLGMKYSTHWRDLGIFSAYIFSNIFLVYVLYYLFREVRWRRVFAGVWNKNNNKQD
ncbi:ABC-2 type transporter-domain-containing protein [Tuber borchii]|uniref:ABC-2 type transporter-domain-containing protein n=1 Tax=Tuber borchii TaxID=42251 RepID=A0A2T6ZI08_TUBBO|nr:ABC-2 type transporter-domain-containing protein [Tuber borchii]